MFKIFHRIVRPICCGQFEHRRPPIAALAGSRPPELGLHSTHSYRYEFRSRPVLSRPSPHPGSAILGEICWLPWPALLRTTMGAAAKNRGEI